MASSAAFDFELGAMETRIEDLDAKLHLAISAAVAEVAVFGSAYAKTNAPWHDNTGAARAGLHSDTSNTGNSWEIVLAHAVSYGIWLEVAHNAKYQIILPTLRVMMDRLGSHLQGMMGDLR
jgi:hypothetical protein